MGLHRNMINEPVTRLALRDPVLCGPDETVRGAIEQMRERKLGCVFVVDDQGHVRVLSLDGTIVGIASPQRITGFLQQYFEDE